MHDLKRNKFSVQIKIFHQIVCTINLAKTHIVYFGILLNCYFNTLCFGLVSFIFLTSYPHLTDLGRGRGHTKYFKLDLMK